ncbi:MAG: hypothetical protein R3Y10_05745 [Ferrimonas sp.]
MAQLQALLQWRPSAQELLLAMDLLIVLLLFVIARFSDGWFSGVDSTKELAERDNIAFGLSSAGSIVALAIAISGLFQYTHHPNIWFHGMQLLLLGLVAIGLIRLARWIFDKWGLQHLDKQQQILSGNVPIALVDSAVACAVALMLKGTMQWFGAIYWGTLPMLLANFIVAVALLVGISRLLEYRYARNNQGGSLQLALAQGQLPLSIRHSVYLLACGLLMHHSALSELLQQPTPVANLSYWLAMTLLKLLLLWGMGYLLRQLVLAKVQVNEEIERQNNTGVAALESALLFAAAYVLSHVF